MNVKVINLWYPYESDGGVNNVTTYLIPSSGDIKVVLTNVCDEMISRNDTILADIILDIDREIQDDDSVFYRNVKRFVRTYDENNLREMNVSSIIKFFKNNENLCIQLLIGIHKSYPKYFKMDTQFVERD